MTQGQRTSSGGSVLLLPGAHAFPLLPAQTAQPGAPGCCLEFKFVGESLGLSPELQEPTTSAGWASGRPQDLQAQTPGDEGATLVCLFPLRERGGSWNGPQS